MADTYGRVRPWDPPAGAELVLFNAANPEESVGPFTSSYPIQQEEFWSATVYSGEVNVEYYLPPGVDPQAPGSGITVDGLLNQYRDPLVTQLRELWCHLDLLCYPAWVPEGNGVAALAYVGGPYSYFCSGGMLNRSPTDFTSLFATANHCGVNVTNESSVIVTWFYQTSVCNGTPPDPSTLPQTLGCAALVNDTSTDYCLLGLQDTVLGALVYLGWDANYWPNGSAGTLIHHPDGSYKRITFGTKTADVTSCIPAAAWQIYVADGDGEDEPGSSGAPMFDASHRVRGTASCATWSCTSDDIIEAGRFDLAYSKLSPYLMPTDPVYVNAGYVGDEQGTMTQPFKRFKKGFFGVIRGHDLYVEAGSYNERLVIDKAMIIHARNGTAVIGQ
jgi:lysyl endopeptidase